MNLTNSQLQLVHEYFTDEAPILYFNLTSDGIVVAVNKFTRKILGRDVTGHFFEDLLVDFKNSFNLTDCSSIDKQYLLTLNIPGRDPKSYHFHFRKIDTSILVFGKDDVDELDLLRTELFSSNQELNNLTRTLHKQNAQLAHLNKIKNQFLGMAAHDLRKPISVILSYSDFILDETQNILDNEHISFLKRIESSATFMKRLVDDFLDVSAIEAGGFQLNLQYINPAEILERSLVMAKIQADKKDVGLEVTVDPHLSSLSLDGEKIEQAMSNLLGNAIEHSLPGKVVSIDLTEVDGRLQFSVRDQGCGMSPEIIKQLFTPFSNTGNVKTGGEKSTGLGLTITRKIVDAHKGEIVAESIEGAGSTFSIYLNSN